MPSSSDSGAVPFVTSVREPLHALRERLELIERRDMASLGALYREYVDIVFRAALRLTASRADAEDVTQEVFIRLPETVRGFTGSSLQFPAWMRRVAVRQSLMHMRGGRRRREVRVDAVASLLAPGNDGSLARLSIETALARIPDDHRTVFLLKEVEGYDHAEIAELLGISTANSEVRLHRARRQLREILRGSR